MSASAQLAIQRLLVAALKQAPALANGRVYANPMRELPEGTPAAITVTTKRSDGKEATLGAIDWRTTYLVECLATVSSGADPVAAVDALLTATWQRLAALPAGGNGMAGLVIQPAIEWDFTPGITAQVSAVMRVDVDHRTLATTLEPWT